MSFDIIWEKGIVVNLDHSRTILLMASSELFLG